jgi:hypothetical protein
MLIERNTVTLREALDALPTYAPPVGLWDVLEEQLDFEEQLDTTVPQLPQYAPPTAIWEQIENQLEANRPQNQPARPIKVYHLIGWSLLTTILLFLGMYWWTHQPIAPATINPPAALPVEPTPAANEQPIAEVQSDAARVSAGNFNVKKQENTTSKPIEQLQQIQLLQPIQQLQQTTTTVDTTLIAICQQPDDPGFALIETLCVEAVPVCKEPVFVALKAELDELTAARERLKEALGQYADDPEMVAQLVALEQSRNQILQQLITLI